MHDPRTTEVYRQIIKRLAGFRPQIDLNKYMRGADASFKGDDPYNFQMRNYGIVAGRTTLDGLTFLPNDKWNDLIVALRSTRTSDGKAGFVEGQSVDKPNIAIDISMANTPGKGFREIGHIKQTPPVYQSPSEKRDLGVPFRSQFGADPATLDLSSLHFSITKNLVNVHIDQTGFVFDDGSGNAMVGPDFAQHTVNELLWKTKLGLPAGLTERVNIMLPNSTNEFSRFGISGDVLTAKDYRVAVTGSCGIQGKFECSVTLGIGGRF